MIIVLLVLLSICLLQVSHAVPHPVLRAAADYLFLRAKGGFPAGMIMGQETLAASCPFSLLYIRLCQNQNKVFVKSPFRLLSAVEVTLHECLELAVVSGDVVAHRAIVEGAEFLEDTVDHLR